MKIHKAIIDPCVLAIGAALLVPSVGCLPGAKLNEDKLVRTASFDHGCPAQKIKLMSEDDDGMGGTGRYLLDVCGEQKRYKRMGTMYYDADKGLEIDGKKID